MAKAVGRAAHKMNAFVRFREIGREAGVALRRLVRAGTSRRRARRAVLREPVRRYGLGDPDAGCLRALGRRCRLYHSRASPGRSAPRRQPGGKLADYYTSIFNPARLKVAAMRNEMPKRYWRNLPEASMLIPLIEGAGRTATEMVANTATSPSRRETAGAAQKKRYIRNARELLRKLRPAQGAAVPRCPLYKDATQGCPAKARQRAANVGRRAARRQEDLAGKPFVGPAGQMLDSALAEAGIDRRTSTSPMR